jgi:hypothetical protein
MAWQPLEVVLLGLGGVIDQYDDNNSLRLLN